MAKEETKQTNEATEEKVDGQQEETASKNQGEQGEAPTGAPEKETLAEEAKEAGNAKKEAGNENKTADLERAMAEQKDKYLRLYSDFENFRRRNAKEKLDLVKTASENLMVALLPILDDFDRTVKTLENKKDDEAFQKRIDESNELKSVIEGIGLIQNKFFKVLQANGLTPMASKMGDPFDPEWQEAVTQIPVEDEKLKGKLVDVIEKGYLMDEKVIRHAKVVTGA